MLSIAATSKLPLRSLYVARMRAARRLPLRLVMFYNALMSMHLIKLCVGCDSIRDLEEWIEENQAHFRRLGRTYEQLHTTRLVPKRLDDLLDSGSLYWVIKGQLACRQRLLAVRPFTDGDGVGRCHLVLEPIVVAVEPRPCRPFQGWRYLAGREAPRDLGRASGDVAVMPEAMRRELADLGLL